jgi:hypothetical protein
VAEIMIGDMDANQLVITGSSEEVYKILIKFLGLYLIVTSLPFMLGQLPWVLIVATGRPNSQSIFVDPPFYVAQQIAPWLTQIITLIIGIWLFFGGKTIARGLVRLKNIGLEPPEKQNVPEDNEPSE